MLAAAVFLPFRADAVSARRAYVLDAVSGRVLYENNARITAEKYLGKTIDVKGIVDFFEGGYQIKVFTPAAIQIHP